MANETMSLHDWLDDLCVRFIINLPREELESVERICFQIEEAQWFYEDFIRPLDPTLPSMNLKTFSLCIFQHCPLLSQFSLYHHSAAFSEFLAYKTRVPVRGAILLNDAMDRVVLVKGWKKGANWSFPRGKINKDEADLDCAIREVYEETGLDVRLAGLVKEEADVKFIDVPMREQNVRLYVFRGVAMDTRFEPKTRKEISKIDWYKLTDLPTFKKSKKTKENVHEHSTRDNKFYMVAPFLGPLRKWINQQKYNDAVKRKSKLNNVPTQVDQQGAETDLTAGEEEEGTDLVVDQLQITSTTVSTGPDQPLENNMNLLLSKLRSSANRSEQPVAHLDQPMADSSKNTANDLKRLLSIGTPSENTAVSAPEVKSPNSNLLLSMLRGNTTTITSVQAKGTQILETKSQQIVPLINPPNSGSISSSDAAVGMIPPVQSSVPREASMTNYDQPLSSNHILSTQSQHAIANANKEQQAEILNNAHRLNQPYHHESDSLISHLSNHSFADTHRAPPASKLPPPKLNSHTMKLLNTLRQPTSTSHYSSSQSVAQKIPTNYPIVVPNQHPTQPDTGFNSNLVSRRGFEATSQAAQTDSSRLLDVLKTNESNKNSNVGMQAQTSQRDKLLGLFAASKQPSASTSPVLSDERPAVPRPATQQTAAQKNTTHYSPRNSAGQGAIAPHRGGLPHPQQHGSFEKTVIPNRTHPGSSEAPRNPPKILKRPQTMDAQIAANAPGHGGNTHQNIPKPVSNEKADVAMRSQARAATLPAELNGSQVHVSNLSNNVKLLQRQPRPRADQPQQAAGNGTKQSQTPFLDRRDQVTTEHKSNLLSLFSKPPPLDTHSTPPAAPDPQLQNTVSKQQLGKPRTTEAVPSSAVHTSVKSNDTLSSKVNTKPSASPVDKQFLLGYLEGVVKGGK